MKKVSFHINKNFDKFMAEQFLDEKGGGIDFGENIVKTHPALRTAKDEPNSRKILVDKYFDRYYASHKHEIARKVASIKRAWEKVEKKFARTTEKIFSGYHFPEWECAAYASITDCNPRFLDSKTFQFFYKKNEVDAVHTIAHELLHFIFFNFVNKKMKRDIKKLSTDKLWDLSEIFNVVVLRSPAYQGIVGKKYVKPYPSHRKYLKTFEIAYRNSKDTKSFIQKGIDILKK